MCLSLSCQQFDKSDRLVNNHEYIFKNIYLNIYLKEYIHYSFSFKMTQTSKSYIFILDPVTSLPGIYLIKILRYVGNYYLIKLFIVASLLMAKTGNTLNVIFRDFVRHICYILNNMYLWGEKKRISGNY